MATSVKDLNLELLNTARNLIVSGDLQKAALTLNAANKQNPSDPRVHMLGGLLAEKSGNVNGAFELLRRAVNMAPGWGPGLLELALLLARQNQFDEAIQVAKKVHAIEPNNAVVLAGVIDIAHRAGALELAIDFLRHGLRLVPNDPQLRLLLATDLTALKQSPEALALWNGLVSEHPDSPDALLGRLQTFLALDQLDQAQQDAAALLALQPDNPVYGYFSEVAHGRTPSQQPPELNAAMFDNMAPTYDRQMVVGSNYRLPELVAEKLLTERPDKKFNVLDLGCGTGLLGAYLGRLDGALVGVETSRKMIDQAHLRNVYDKFHTVNLHDALEATPESLYEVIAALDVFTYAGNLTNAIPDAHRILVPGGQLVLSCESAPEAGADMLLQPTGRFAHRQSHVEALCQSAGFAKVDVEATTLRMDNGQPVPGFVVWATKAAAPIKKPRAPRAKKQAE